VLSLFQLRIQLNNNIDSEPNFHNENTAPNSSNILDNIIILDESKVDVANIKSFTMGDVDGDDIDELIAFKTSIKNNISSTMILLYENDRDNWILKNPPFYLELQGSVYLSKAANFNTDNRDAVITCNINGENNSLVYLLRFENLTGEIFPSLIYSCDNIIRDFEILPSGDDNATHILIITNNFNVSTHQLESCLNIVSLYGNGTISDDFLYSDRHSPWTLLSIGKYLPINGAPEFQILLFQTRTFQILDLNGSVIVGPILFDKERKPRDITAWDVENDGIDELVVLESENSGQDNGYINQLTIYSIYRDNVIVKTNFKLQSYEWLKALDTGHIDGSETEKLVILDSPGGSCRVLLALDDEATLFYFLGAIVAPAPIAVHSIVKWFYVTLTFYLDLNIDLILTKIISYESDDSKDRYYQLYSNLVAECEDDRITNCADIVLGIIFNYRITGDWGIGGFATRGTRFAAVYHDFGNIWVHEIGHLFDLGWTGSGPNGHCGHAVEVSMPLPPINDQPQYVLLPFPCVMNYVAGVHGFCDYCRDEVDPVHFENTRDYTFSSPSVSDYGAHHHNDAGYWSVSGTIPQGWSVMVYVDDTYQGDSLGAYSIPTSPGTHILKVETYDAGVNLVKSELFTEYIFPNRAPEANAGQDIVIYNGLTVHFNGLGSYDVDDDSLNYSWAFGDGSTGTGPTPTHVYFIPDVYSVVLTVSDGLDGADQDTLLVTVRNVVLVSIDDYDLNPHGGINAYFTVSTIDPELSFDTVEICVDGNCFYSLGSNFVTIYNLGMYTIVVTGYFADGESSMVSRAFEITAEVVESVLSNGIEKTEQIVLESDIDQWNHPGNNRKNVVVNKLDELNQLVSICNYLEAYDKLLHDLKPKLTGLKTDEHEQLWGSGVFNNPWVIDTQFQEEFRLRINAILDWLSKLINDDVENINDGTTNADSTSVEKRNRIGVIEPVPVQFAIICVFVLVVAIGFLKSHIKKRPGILPWTY
jgi:PKD repeat protein